uniref:Gypsy retrotransposon integrase-like protein 1 n=1 Tax=Erpetoichthys calabaricus TaxID=27687 RepID=A0A8C4RHI8_ERPCA
MEKLQPPPSLQLSGNLAENWKRFKQRFEVYLAAIGADEKSDKMKTCILLHIIGEEALEIYNNFQFDQGEHMKLDVILDKFERYCIPKRNVTFERHKFFTCIQKQGETIDQYVTELRTRSKTCEFGELTESLIKDRIVCGIPDNALRERLLRELDLDLEKTVRICRAAETIKVQVKEMCNEVNAVHVLNKKGKNKMQLNTEENKSGNKTIYSTKQACGRCGSHHAPRQCPAYNKVCKKCGKNNHFARCCKSQVKPSQVHTVEETEVEEFYIDALTEVNGRRKEWILPVQVNNAIISFKLDTGAQVNIMPENEYRKLQPRPSLQETEIKITGYSGMQIPVTGQCVACVKYKNKKYSLVFVVVPKRVQAILGLSACEKMNLIERVLTINIEDNTEYEALLQKYSDLFLGLGCLPGEHKIITDKNVSPVIHPCRKVPFALKEKLAEELDRMESLQVIKKINEPTEWVNSLVIVEKKDGKLRICLDPRDLNRAIKREHFKLPTREEIMAQFANAKYFSKLDASSGFWQLKLDESSSKLCTFNTPFGRYQFLRLPFGIASAPEVYHKTIHMIFEHFDGVDTSMDDIIVWGSSKEEHDERLKKVLDATRTANLKLNKGKCLVGVQELTFLGDILSSEGVKPDKSKVSAIENMPRPQCKKDIQRFIGMVNYQAKFIPNLSNILAPLRQLTEKNVEWTWNYEQETAWNEVKKLLIKEPVLKFYDPHKPIKISSDASQSGLGAVLLQKHDETWQPVAYASRSLTGAETRYAQIEKELLSITFACERFHQFVSGQAIMIETDHKPLLALFKKPLNDCPLRIQRMMIKLQRYTLQVTFTPGRWMFTADTLSRAVDEKYGHEEKSSEVIEAYVDMVIKAMPVSDSKTQLIRTETAKDEVMQMLKEVIVQGWPENKHNCNPQVSDYWNCRAELTVVDGIIYKGCKIVIPLSLRKQMLQKIHEGHLGIEKCKKRAREVMYWPKINQDVSNEVERCSVCLKYRPSNPSEPLSPHPVPERPYEKVGVDLFTCHGKDFLMVTDYFSAYPEVCALNTTNSETVIKCLKAVFSRYGVPNVVFSDNGPQFTSLHFKNFAKEWDFVHQTSSPNYPQSNGLVERSIHTIKHLMKKSKESGSDFYKSLLIYRSTPLEHGASPAQLLMGRRLRSNLPMKQTLLKSGMEDKVRKVKENINRKQKIYFDRGTRILPELEIGEEVRIKDSSTNTWNLQGAVKEQIDPRSYIVETSDGTVLRRNRRDIVVDKTSKEPSKVSTETVEMTTSTSRMSESGRDSSETLRRSSRVKQPPTRLIETC